MHLKEDKKLFWHWIPITLSVSFSYLTVWRLYTYECSVLSLCSCWVDLLLWIINVMWLALERKIGKTPLCVAVASHFHLFWFLSFGRDVFSCFAYLCASSPRVSFWKADLWCFCAAGWLYRDVQESWIRQWRQWFVLTQDSLDCYSGQEKSSRRLGSLVLTSLCSVIWPDKQTYKETGKKAHLLHGAWKLKIAGHLWYQETVWWWTFVDFYCWIIRETQHFISAGNTYDGQGHQMAFFDCDKHKGTEIKC